MSMADSVIVATSASASNYRIRNTQIDITSGSIYTSGSFSQSIVELTNVSIKSRQPNILNQNGYLFYFGSSDDTNIDGLSILYVYNMTQACSQPTEYISYEYYYDDFYFDIPDYVARCTNPVTAIQNFGQVSINTFRDCIIISSVFSVKYYFFLIVVDE